MSLGTIKTGTYGKYYEFIENGKKKTLALKFPGNNLSEEQIDELIENKKLSFIDSGGNTITAVLSSFYNEKFKRESLVVKYSGTAIESVDKDADVKKIEDNLENIRGILCEHIGGYANMEVSKFLQTLGLSHRYPRCEVVPTEVPGVTQVYLFYGYQGDWKNSENVYIKLYLKELEKTGQYSGNRVFISNYQEELDKYEEQKRLNREKEEKEKQLYNECIQKGIEWINSLKNQLYEGDRPIQDKYKRIEALEPIVTSQSVSDMTRLINRPPKNIKDNFNDVENYVEYKIYRTSPEDDLERLKENTLIWLREYYDYHRLRNVRHKLWERIQTEGLEAVVDPVDINQALDLGKFKELKKALKKRAGNPERFIIYNMFMDMTEEKELEEKLLNMLKVYYDFFDFPSKDIAVLAAFIAKNNLSEYYDKVLEHDEAVESILGDSSVSTKTKSSILSRILKEREREFLESYSFTIKTRVKEGIIVNDPIEVTQRLVDLIPEYNVASDVAILNNVELSASGDEFIYKFYTFSKDSKGQDFDGRRLQYMTRLYNQRHDPKIYFEYDESVEEGKN